MESSNASPSAASPRFATRASILAIGTELTSGQIVNRNAAWISSKLQDLGVEVVLHETVPDSRPLILSALRRCEEQGSLIFVTGGLGPTTDDFTREVIAEWAGQPLEFHEPSWQHIEQRLWRLGVKVAESNRQQCYFPKGSRVLPNSQGTANGFFLEKGSALAWILPGPPNEIDAIWRATPPETEILRRFPALPKLQLFRWSCMGKSEAELGELTENALKESGLLTGYRAHRPYIEVKVWCDEKEVARHAPDFARLEAAIGPWVVGRGNEDLAESLLRALARDQETEILDSASGGLLAERLAPILRKPEFRRQAGTIVLATEWTQQSEPDEWLSAVLVQADEQAITLALAGPGKDGAFRIGFRAAETLQQELLPTPFTGQDPAAPELAERGRRYAVEMALKRWQRWLEDSVN